MAKVFYPENFILVPASAPHPANTEYKVSIGPEDWSGIHRNVVKVQMVYNGVVSGRRSPSYPVGTDDYERVDVAVKELLKKL